MKLKATLVTAIAVASAMSVTGLGIMSGQTASAAEKLPFNAEVVSLQELKISGLPATETADKIKAQFIKAPVANLIDQSKLNVTVEKGVATLKIENGILSAATLEQYDGADKDGNRRIELAKFKNDTVRVEFSAPRKADGNFDYEKASVRFLNKEQFAAAKTELQELKNITESLEKAVAAKDLQAAKNAIAGKENAIWYAYWNAQIVALEAKLNPVVEPTKPAQPTKPQSEEVAVGIPTEPAKPAEKPKSSNGLKAPNTGEKNNNFELITISFAATLLTTLSVVVLKKF